MEQVENKIPEVIYSSDMNDYETKNVVGYGATAQVAMAIFKPHNKKVAIKMIDIDKFERNQIDEVRREIQIMSLCRHPNLLPIFRSFISSSRLHIVTPLRSAGSCSDLLKLRFKQGMEETAIATIMKQVLQGVSYLHKNGLIHRDIKCANLLMDKESGLVQLADFGVSSSLLDFGVCRKKRKTFVGSLCWMSPEVMEQKGYNYKADIWSFGITALELANGIAPYAKFPPLKVCLLVLNNDPPALNRHETYHKYSRSFEDVVDACLLKNPDMRPSADALLSFPFFKKARSPDYLVKVLELDTLEPLTSRVPKDSKSNSEYVMETVQAWDFDIDIGQDGDDELESTGSSDSRTRSNSSVSDAQMEELEYRTSAVRIQDPPASSFYPSPVPSASESSDIDTLSSSPSASSNTLTISKRGRFQVTSSAPSSLASSPVPSRYPTPNQSPIPSLDRSPAKRGRFEVTTS